MKKLILFLLLGGILGVAILLPILLIDSKPAVIRVEEVKPETLRQSRKLVKEILKTLDSNSEHREISLDSTQASGLLAIASRTFPFLSLRLNQIDRDWLVTGTLRLGSMGAYVNTRTYLAAGNISLDDTTTEIGGLEFSNRFLLETGIAMVNSLNSNNTNINPEHLYRAIELRDSKLRVEAHPSLNYSELKNNLKQSANQAIKHATLNQDYSNQISHYLKLLNKLTGYLQGLSGNSLSLFDLAQPLYVEASTSPNGDPADIENKYALLALVYFAGDYPIQRLITSAYAPRIAEPPANNKLLIRGRRDLTLHFLYSAALEMLASDEISFNIGELKEISDTARGGSGFSFVDLMADRAGIYFARTSTASAEVAFRLQQNVKQTSSEDDFFPDISYLPEGLNAEELEQTIGNTKSKRYQQIVKDIDGRIARLSIYRQ